MYRHLIGLSLVAGASAQCLPPLRSNYDFKGVGPSSTTPFDLKWDYESAADYFMSHYVALKAAAQVKVDAGTSGDLSTAMADVGTDKSIATATVQAAQGLLAACAATPGATCERAVTMAYICGDDVPTIVCNGTTITATYADPEEYSVSVAGNTWSVKYSNGAVLATGSVGTAASAITPITQACVSDGLCDSAVSITLAEDILPTSDADLEYLDDTGTKFVLDYEEASAREYFHTLYLSGVAALDGYPLPSSFAGFGTVYGAIYTNTYNACPEVDGAADTACEKDQFLSEMCDKGPTTNCDTAGVVKASYNDGSTAYTLDNDASSWSVRYTADDKHKDKILVTGAIGSGATSVTPMTQKDDANPVSVTLATAFEPLYLGTYDLNTDETDVACPFGTVSASCTDSVLSVSGCYTTEAGWVAVDADKDGVLDGADAFPTDATETVDTDGDGVGDNADAFPTDATETVDTDSDGVGDNADAFPTDATETVDTDGDGVGDNADAFPTDATETVDTDGDGVGDNADAFPTDATETVDTDGDGVGDNADVFPTDATETVDTDGDGVGDNADAFPTDATETVDTDGDGVGDNADVFPTDATETVDSDNDGTGDVADLCDSDPDKTSPGDCGCGNAPKANFWCAGGAQTEHQKCGAGFGVPTGLVNNLPSDQSFTCDVCGDLDNKYSLIEDYSGCADHTRCPAGQEPKAKDGSSNPGCKPCGGESFTTDTDYADCTPKVTCSGSQYEVSAGSATTNRACATKVCTCTDGSPVSALACTTHDTEQCGICTIGFANSGVQCLVDTDGDGSANVDDSDDDNDNLSDAEENSDGTDPLVKDTDGDNVDDDVEKTDGTDPLDTDSDDDGVSDGVEKTDGTDPLDIDSDDDGVSDGQEKTDGTDPLDADSDDDGVNDGQENADGTDPLDADSDDDGVSDGQEKTDGTDPLDTDSDDDGVSDGVEKADGTDPLDADSDDDGVSDGVEKADGTDPLDADSDDDGVNDGQEKTDGTDPLDADSDDDGVNDGQEKTDGTDPLDADSDDDGLTDSQEVTHDTDPLDADTDDDGLNDGTEVNTHNTEPDAADTDGDGLSDHSEINDGNANTDALTPDTDGDGVSDKDDLCHGVDDNDCCFAQKTLADAGSVVAQKRYIALQCCNGLMASCAKTSAV